MPELVEKVAERLYAAPPDGFVAARDEAVAAAKAGGDTVGAAALAKLRRPSVAAWLVNLLAIRRPDLVDELVELSEALRAAQRDLRGGDLRELSRQRRQAVSGLVETARSLAVATDARLATAKLPLGEVESTLTAALSEVEVANQVRTGRLTRAVRYAGFGEVPRPQLRLVTAAEAATAPARDVARPVDPPEPDLDTQCAALRGELVAVRTAARKAAAALERAIAAERAGADALAGVEQQIAELERRRAAAEADVSRRKMERKAADRELIAARRRVGTTEAALEAVEGMIADRRASRRRG